MNIQCPECGARYRIDPSRTTKTVARVKCPRCAHIFQLSLPENRQRTSPLIAEPSPLVPRRPDRTRKALVVDDSKFFRELVVDVLKSLPLSFLTAADGNEAIQIIRAECPALVIVDLNLSPGKNGYQVIQEVRADPALRDIRLLAMSGVYRQTGDAAEARHAGADDFISKSFRPEQLQARVANLLEG